MDINNGIVYVNGQKIDDSFISTEKSDYTGHFSVPEDSYFILGDNRNHSNDSRYWKSTHFVRKENIQAIAKFRIFPLHRIGVFLINKFILYLFCVVISFANTIFFFWKMNILTPTSVLYISIGSAIAGELFTIYFNRRK